MTRLLAPLAMALALLAPCSCNVGPKGDPTPDGNEDWEPTGPYSLQAVDLGLPVLWANGNLGANAIDDSGDYYAWGETATKSSYDWASYKWCGGDHTSLTKYNNSALYGEVDNLVVLQRREEPGETMDDVAREKLKGRWRMPTAEEWNALMTQCTWTPKTTKKGVKGYLVKSTASGNPNAVFIPLTGYMSDDMLLAKSTGAYWTSDLDTATPTLAKRLLFTSTDKPIIDGSGRNFGFAVRPVQDK